MIPQNMIRTFMERHGISAEILCKATGVSPASLSRYMNWNKNLPDLIGLLQTLETLDQIANDSPPYSIPYSDPAAVRKLIDEYRNNGTRYIPVPIDVETKQ
jgi:transcriptional regulator with XRE-family HTH domain